MEQSVETKPMPEEPPKKSRKEQVAEFLKNEKNHQKKKRAPPSRLPEFLGNNKT